jgi:hypothetical protein
MKDKFIKALEEISNPQISNQYHLGAWQAKAINIVSRIYGDDSKQENQINKIDFKKYPSMRFNGVSTGGGNNSVECSGQAKDLILGIIDDLKTFGIPEIKNKESDSGINISVNQMQNQSVNINIVLESMEDELTGKQMKELKKILKGKDKPEEKKKKILGKLTEFGSNVASNVLSTILTNPAILGSL